ncbi:hypothetical protein L9F63_005986, partial [Diploptera punctata]
MGTRFLELLISVSEKAANIARVIRQDEHLFKLLVQEKKSTEKNPRFVQDFKTLADVLIQETVKHDVGKRFPDLAEHILGEESNSFCNILGETITVQVQESESETAELLSRVLGGDMLAAEVLAAEVHRDLNAEELALEKDLPQMNLPLDGCGMWIDPIDSTAEYISGEEVRTVGDICQSGLRCVTVLIGVFDRTSGIPILGIINQPFHTLQDTKWQGICHWGVKFENICQFSKSLPQKSQHRTSKRVVLSSSESEELKSRLSSAGYTIAEASGAGYKQLCVACNDADVYVLSKGSTFRWDTCGPHAILKSLGGGIVTYNQVLESTSPLDSHELCYSSDDTTYCNSNGLIAFRDRLVAEELIQTLRQILMKRAENVILQNHS